MKWACWCDFYNTERLVTMDEEQFVGGPYELGNSVSQSMSLWRFKGLRRESLKCEGQG